MELISEGLRSMSTKTVYHSYNDIVAHLYDLDPQNVTKDSLDRAIQQLNQHHYLGDDSLPLRVLDLGMGTGMFLASLKQLAGEQIIPFGLDLADNMIDNARRKIPDLIAEVDDAANFEAHFPGQLFDCVSTHFITGFVPMTLLAPKIYHRLDEGGCWSFVGGTKEGFPELRRKARSRILQRYGGGDGRTIDEELINPVNDQEVIGVMEANGFDVLAVETFRPPVRFGNFDDFMEFGYHGGWFTPIIETVGLHKAGAFTRWLMNRLVFPINDHHSVVIALGRKKLT
jgi:SAM-dependent methyltransferase